MFWGLFRMMMCLITVPFKIIRTAFRMVAVVLLPIMVIKTIKHLMHK